MRQNQCTQKPSVLLSRAFPILKFGAVAGVPQVPKWLEFACVSNQEHATDFNALVLFYYCSRVSQPDIFAPPTFRCSGWGSEACHRLQAARFWPRRMHHVRRLQRRSTTPSRHAGEAWRGLKNRVRDALTKYTQAISGAYYFMPSAESLRQPEDGTVLESKKS